MIPMTVAPVAAARARRGQNNPVNFHVWIDGRSHVRKMIETESVNGEHVTTTVYIAAINQPVHVTVPPASQTAPMPGV